MLLALRHLEARPLPTGAAPGAVPALSRRRAAAADPPVSVPLPLSVRCEQRRHEQCDGVAIDVLRDEPTECCCPCHDR